MKWLYNLFAPLSSSIPPDHRIPAYCGPVLWGENATEDWEFLLSRYQDIADSQTRWDARERPRLLHSLACPQSGGLLTRSAVLLPSYCIISQNNDGVPWWLCASIQWHAIVCTKFLAFLSHLALPGLPQCFSNVDEASRLPNGDVVDSRSIDPHLPTHIGLPEPYASLCSTLMFPAVAFVLIWSFG